MPLNISVKNAFVFGTGSFTTTMEEHVVRRFALAHDPAMFAEARRVGWRTWFERELIASPTKDSAMLSLLSKELPLSTLTFPQAKDYTAARSIQFSGVPIGAGGNQRRGTTIIRTLLTPRPLHESLSQFWLDFFSIPYLENPVGTYTIDLEIRNVALTSFPTILRKMYSSLKIFEYLDNTRNNRGAMNENLARETLELYSVGDGNFTERDMEQLTILLTGRHNSWNGRGALDFHPSHHAYTSEPLTILGRQYPNDGSVNLGTQLYSFIDALAMDRRTAVNVCTRLARRFVQDDPPSALIDGMVSVYMRTRGDVKELLRYIVNSYYFRNSAGLKWRRPGEYFDSYHRSMGVTWAADPSTSGSREFYLTMSRYLSTLSVAGHEPRAWKTPDGYPDKASRWQGSSALNQALKLVQGNAPVDPELTRIGQWSERLGITTIDTSTTTKIANNLVGYQLPSPIKTVVDSELSGYGTTNERIDRAVRALYVSPLAWIR